MNNNIVMAYAYELTGDDDYLDGVVSGMDYILGRNQWTIPMLQVMELMLLRILIIDGGHIRLIQLFPKRLTVCL